MKGRKETQRTTDAACNLYTVHNHVITNIFPLLLLLLLVLVLAVLLARSRPAPPRTCTRSHAAPSKRAAPAHLLPQPGAAAPCRSMGPKCPNGGPKAGSVGGLPEVRRLVCTQQNGCALSHHIPTATTPTMTPWVGPDGAAARGRRAAVHCTFCCAGPHIDRNGRPTTSYRDAG